MAKLTQQRILEAAAELFSSVGVEHFSIRFLTKKLQTAPSSVYYHFKNEDELLKSMFQYLNRQLGEKRAALPQPESAKEMLKQRIRFQIEHTQAIVAVLKYYLYFRKEFPRFGDGFLPDKSSLHIEEVLKYGQKTGEFKLTHLLDDAKVITHAINGFLLEYHPYIPTEAEKEMLTERMYSFLIRALEV